MADVRAAGGDGALAVDNGSTVGTPEERAVIAAADLDAWSRSNSRVTTSPSRPRASGSAPLRDTTTAPASPTRSSTSRSASITFFSPSRNVRPASARPSIVARIHVGRRVSINSDNADRGATSEWTCSSVLTGRESLARGSSTGFGAAAAGVRDSEAPRPRTHQAVPSTMTRPARTNAPVAAFAECLGGRAHGLCAGAIVPTSTPG